MSASEAEAARVGRALHAYAEALREAHARAVARGGAWDETRRVGGRVVRWSVAGPGLGEAIKPALEHMPPAGDGEVPEFTICAWDEREYGVARPVAPWREPGAGEICRRVLPAGAEDFRIPAGADDAVESFGAMAQGRGFWVKHGEGPLATHHRAAPFLALWHWWTATTGLRLVHAGCVGDERGAVLLAGPGGAGKSTTALLCLLAGADYLSDDYCLVRPGAAPEAYCLFATGKLHRDQLGRFPELAARAVDPGPDVFRKPVIFVGHAWPERVATARPLRALLVPRVVGTGATRAVPIGAAEALRALGPSSLRQLPGRADGRAWGDLAALARALPCFRLELGAETRDAAAVVRAVLEENR